jgi:hypothetical protein
MVFLAGGVAVHAQVAAHAPAAGVNNLLSVTRDTIPVIKDCLHVAYPQITKDSVRSIANATAKDMRAALRSQRQQTVATVRNSLRPPKLHVTDTFPVSIQHPFKQLWVTRPAFRLNGGMVSYNFNYRAVIDTPYAEKDLLQHNVTGKLAITVAGIVPLQVNYWIRQTNSAYFRNIHDVQLSFNGKAFQNNLQAKARARMLALAPTIKDSLLEKQYGLKQTELTGIGNELKTVFYPQKLIEANETLKVPKYTWNGSLPDSVNERREDSLRKVAAAFLDQYEQTKQRYGQVSNEVDSLKNRYEDNLKKVNQFKQLVNGNWNDLHTAADWKNSLQQYGMEQVALPAQYRWLLGVRNFSLGRSPVNYSELTAKNISVNGINFEYNSWYYFAVTAGAVNYRFRDFAVNGAGKKPQFLYLVRAGIGRLERNYFILSGFSGQKQLLTASTGNNGTIRVSGISAAARWAVNRFTYVTAEAAKSMAPDYRTSPVVSSSKLSLSDNNTQAVALHLYSNLPATGTRLEGYYKKTGANYQSFSSYTTNAALESWTVKADQNLFKRKLHIAASLRKNEYTNPFIVQDYTSNTIFKSIAASLRTRRLPVVTLAYQPLSQLTKVGDQVIENRFQTFNATLFHQYKIKQLNLSTTIMVNRFYNNSSDTGFIYYNATNSYLSQSFIFSTFIANVAVSATRNSSYTLQVLEGGIQPGIPKLGAVGIGIKINNLNNSIIKAGGYATANIRIYKQDMLLLHYEHGYLPGNAHNLVRNDMGTVQFVKTFNFR